MFSVIQSIVIDLSLGEAMHSLASALFPICRSITGNGLRESLRIISSEIPLEIREVASGTAVFDWEVPREWNISDAYIKNSKGEKILDFRNSNLHVLNYSIPVHQHVTLAELKKHLHYDKEHPEWIPYRTSYYKEEWGFCMSYNQYCGLEDEMYEVCIDSTLMPGSLTYGECFIQGELSDEVLISSHICHPSLANDNLSGVSVATMIARKLLQSKPRYSYRFLFIPGTIGAITWLAQNEHVVPRIKHGLVASLLGGPGPFTYKKSRRGDTEIDQVAEFVLKSKSSTNNVIDFFPYGYDERQYCSPGFNLAVGCLSRTPFGQYDEYHTSADNLEYITTASLEDSYHTYLEIINVLESNKKYINVNPKCEPQLGRRGLYNQQGGDNDNQNFQLAALWILNLSDGEHTLVSICQKSKMSFNSINFAAQKLLECGLLREPDSDELPSRENSPLSLLR
ncbi:MAG TPA: DUF4910 domain-containing protein [Chryseolinea sp.]|nr:DUF4910 domain-containing protein [Chryseolinea sp.]